MLSAEDASDLLGISLTPEQQSVLAVLLQFASGVSPFTDPKGLSRHGQLSQLGRWHEQSGSSIANALRVQTGGKLTELPDVDDPLILALLTVARDVWPSLLLSPPTDGYVPFWFSLPLGVSTHPATVDAARAFLGDQNLKGLFPRTDSIGAHDDVTLGELWTIRSSWLSSSGRGGDQQLMTLLAFIITSSHLRSLVEWGDASWDSLVAEVPVTVETLRRLAGGETVDVPRLIAFAGLRFPEGLLLELPVGVLRSMRPIEQSYLLMHSESSSSTCLLRTTYPLQLTDIGIAVDEPVKWRGWRSVRNHQERVARSVNLLRLAVLLASPEEFFWGLIETASLILDPTIPGGMAYSTAAESRFALPSHEIDSHGCERIAGWHQTVDSLYPANLDVAMRRVLTAASDRPDPVDSFVDAVVAWENCFGSSTDATFRVSAAIARLLEDAAEERLSRQKELSKLYGKRSRVVHGALHPGVEQALEWRDSALRTAVECLRVLLADRPELVNLTSEERCTRILLDALPATSAPDEEASDSRL